MLPIIDTTSANYMRGGAHVMGIVGEKMDFCRLANKETSAHPLDMSKGGVESQVSGEQ